MRRGLLLYGLMSRPVSSLARAQTFEVASVKVPPVVSGEPYNINLGTIQHDTVTLTNVSLADCVKFAYGLSSDSQLSGPDWIKSKEVRYDIVAKTAPGTTREQALQMMQALLAERFKLALHREQRVLAYYALVVAKGGPKMPEAKDVSRERPCWSPRPAPDCQQPHADVFRGDCTLALHATPSWWIRPGWRETSK